MSGLGTQWFSVYHSFEDNRHINFVKFDQQYGPIMRYRPNKLSINNATGLLTIYMAHTKTKGFYFYKTMKFYIEIPSTHATTDKAQHSRKRRILALALSDHMLHVYEAGFTSILEKFMKSFDAPFSKDGWSATPIDDAHGFGLLSFDSMGYICLKVCEYIAACLNEWLRLMPIIGGCPQRELLQGGFLIDDQHHIPQCTDVGVPHYA